MKTIYFANYGDDTLVAYKTNQERLDAINEDCSLADDENGTEERKENIECYEYSLVDCITDENLVFEREAINNADIEL